MEFVLALRPELCSELSVERLCTARSWVWDDPENHQEGSLGRRTRTVSRQAPVPLDFDCYLDQILEACPIFRQGFATFRVRYPAVEAAFREFAQRIHRFIFIG